MAVSHNTTPRRTTSTSSGREALAGLVAAYLSVLRILENNGRYLNLNPKCEPQLGKRGLYRAPWWAGGRRPA